jgi:hypothetical protein
MYMTILALTSLIFGIAYFHDNLAIATLTLSTTALFIVSSASLPSFAANRFLSTLALVPLLHLLYAALRRRPLAWSEVFMSSIQALFLAFAISARSSAQWCVIAFIASLFALIILRRFEMGRQDALSGQRKDLLQRLAEIPYIRRVSAVGLLFLTVTMAVGLTRNIQIDERYFWEDNFPHHLFWHNAYIALTLNPAWPAYKPFPDVPLSGDGAGFKVFEHRMQEQGQPFSSKTNEIYSNYYLRARLYESVIRDEYLNFIVVNPQYAFKLFAYYKPKEILNVLATVARSTEIASLAIAIVSLVCVIALLAWPINGRSSCIEAAIILGLVVLGSFLPVLWAYPATYVFADQLWSILFALLALLGFSAAQLLRTMLRRHRPNMYEPRAQEPYLPQIAQPQTRAASPLQCTRDNAKSSSPLPNHGWR